MIEYEVVERDILFDHPIAKIVVDTLEHSGKRRPYFYLASPIDAVATVGLTDENRIMLTRQYRHPVGKTIYDLPAGRLKPGEDPIEGARREFEEETGYYPNHIEKIGYYNQFPGMMRAATNLFFAHNLVASQQNLDEGEELVITELHVNEILEMILSGDIMDGSLQLGILLSLQKGLISV
jgi:ADP-ribose pyrophosphatase